MMVFSPALLLSLGLAASGVAPLSSSDDLIVDRFVDVCTKGVGRFPAGSVAMIQAGDLPSEIRSYVGHNGSANIYRLVGSREAYLISKHPARQTPETYRETCSLVLRGLSIGGVAPVVASKTHMIYRADWSDYATSVSLFGPNLNYEIALRYLQSENTATDQRGIRYLVIQTSIYNDEQIQQLRAQEEREVRAFRRKQSKAKLN